MEIIKHSVNFEFNRAVDIEPIIENKEVELYEYQKQKVIRYKNNQNN